VDADILSIFSAELPATLPEELLKKYFSWWACFVHEIDGMELPGRMQVS